MNDEKLKKLLGEPISNLCQSEVDKFIEENVSQRHKLGMGAVIIRHMVSNCCDWCKNLAGMYEYGKEPKDVYRRHDNCNCLVTFKSSKGGYKDVYSKKEFGRYEDVKNHRLLNIDAEKYDYLLNKKYNKSIKIKSEKDLMMVSKSNILKMDSIDDIKSYFLNEYDIFLDGFEDVDLFKAKALFAGYDDFITQYPKSGEFIRKISFNKRLKDYGIINDFGMSEIGSIGLGDYGTGVHEAAHALDFYMSKVGNDFSESVLKEARKVLGLRKNSKAYKKYLYEIIGMDVQWNSATQDREVFAYAIETAFGKGKNNALTRTIVDLLNRMVIK